ncbi:MAG: substrate-binding domain-containing protein [Tepidiformaceae bacterium]
MAENRIVAVAPPSHQLVGLVVSFAELTKFALVGYAAGSARSALERWLQGHPDQAVRYAAQSDSSLAVKSMALAMDSAAFIVRGAIGDELKKGELVELDVVDFDVSYPLYAVYSSVENLGEGARRYLDQLRAIWSRIQTRAAERAVI